jgi:hypothetical protein
VADALSRIAYTQSESTSTTDLLNVVELQISASEEWLDDVRRGYLQDVMFGPVLEHLQRSGPGKDIRVTNNRRSRRIRERSKAYFLQDGLLYHRVSGGKFCIP